MPLTPSNMIPLGTIAPHFELPNTNESNGFMYLTPGYFLSMLATMIKTDCPALPHDFETIH